MTPIPVAITVDNMGNAADIGRGHHLQADPAEPGLRVGLPRIARLLSELDLPATFFVEGWNALHHGDRIEQLLAVGHEIALHGWVHEPWSTLDPRRERAILAAGKAALDSLGADVSGFRAPGGRRTELTLDLLAELGFSYDSSLGEEHVIDRSGVVIAPFAWSAVDWWWYNVRTPMASPAEWQAGWLDLLDAAARDQRPLVLIAHARVSAVDPVRADLLEGVLRHVAEHARFEPMLMRDLAQRLAQQG